jgi:acetylornithine deacetylase/succinyl-diaminopimelate desuccinylase-like protein
MSLVDPVLQRLTADFPAAVGRLEDLLRIPSISTDPAFKAETRRAGQWLVDQLTSIGFEASLRDTPGHPMLVAHHPGPGNGPHLLYYGHYDVQPPDPLPLWRSDPFQPQIVEGPRGKRVVARGAVDDKGQLMAIIEAFRAWVAVHGSLPCRITMLIEGEEETGSPSFAGFLAANRDELKADVCILSDTSSWDMETPAITTMLRGLVYVEVTLHGPSHDLHSGLYGGGVVNPINALTRVLGQLHDAAGRVQIPGFYDDVAEMSAEELGAWRGLGFDEQAFLAGAGLRTPSGEAGRSALERLWSRPTCDLNGIHGGYTGAGTKTVIAAKASAKLSCRLVANQDPARIVAGIRAFFDARTPPDCRWEFEVHGASPAIRVPTDSAFLGAARRGLADIYGREAVLIGGGGSIPAVGMIQAALGVDALLVGFGLEDDLIHSPNEKFELRCYENGMKSHAAILARIVELNRTSK